MSWLIFTSRRARNRAIIFFLFFFYFVVFVIKSYCHLLFCFVVLVGFYLVVWIFLFGEYSKIFFFQNNNLMLVYKYIFFFCFLFVQYLFI